MNLNWPEMKKEHKQAVILIAMWVVGGLFALYQFVLQPFLTDRGESVNELDELRTLIVKAQVAMSGETKARADYAEAMRLYRQVSEGYVVPESNPLGWVQDKLHACAVEAGVSIQAISPVGGTAPPAWEALIKADRVYKPYAVRVITEASYPQLVAMIGTLERSNPYLAVVGVIVGAQDQNRQRHSVAMIVEWPMWGKKPNLQMSGDGTTKPARKAAARK